MIGRFERNKVAKPLTRDCPFAGQIRPSQNRINANKSN
jgi:hypothetical protein